MNFTEFVARLKLDSYQRLQYLFTAENEIGAAKTRGGETAESAIIRDIRLKRLLPSPPAPPPIERRGTTFRAISVSLPPFPASLELRFDPPKDP